MQNYLGYKETMELQKSGRAVSVIKESHLTSKARVYENLDCMICELDLDKSFNGSSLSVPSIDCIVQFAVVNCGWPC